MEDFCKIFKYDDIGQVLIKVDGDEDNVPEVRFWFDAGIKGLGITSTAIGFEDSSEGWDNADKYFALLTEEKTKTAIDKTIKEIVRLMEDN